MAWACTSESLNVFIKAILAAGTSWLLRMMDTTSSIFAMAISKPDSICSLRWALFKSNLVRLVTISWRCLTYAFMTSLSDKMRGRPSTMASMLTAKEVCSCVCLNK